MSADRTNDQDDLERRLAGWRPAHDRLDRDRMLFAAGAASARARARGYDRAWALALAASMLGSLGLGVQLARERSLRQEYERTLAIAKPNVIERPMEERAFEFVTSPDSYLSLTRRALRGLDDPISPGRGRPSGEAPSMPEPPTLSPLCARDLDGLRSL
jgi:hypothetical protein